MPKPLQVAVCHSHNSGLFAEEVKVGINNITEQKEEIAEKIDRSFDPDVKTSHLNKLIEIINKFQSDLNNDFDIHQEGSITHQIKDIINQNVGDDGRLIRSIEKKFSFDNPESTIVILQLS